MSGNTIDPRLLSHSASPTDKNQMFDPSQLNADKLANLTPADFDFEGMDFNAFPMNFDEEEPVLPAPDFTFDPVAADQIFSKAPQEVVPMQQSVHPSPATVFPTPPAGYAYHPQVGWYMPVPAPTGFSGAAPFGMPPQFPGPPMPVPIQAALPQVPAFNVAPAKQAPQKLESFRPTRGTKRKYGPAVYLEEQTKRRAMGDDGAPRPVSRDYEYGHKSANASQSGASQVKQNSGRGGGVMKELKNATVQRCRCAPAMAQAETHVRRPRNAFMVFRNDFSAQWSVPKGQKRGNDNKNISIEAGKVWRSLGEKGQAPYKKRAAEEAAKHKQHHPDYTYTPMKGIQAKFGQPSCTCGAYKANMTEYERQKTGGATPPNKFRVLGDADGDDVYVAPRTRSSSRNESIQVPTAQMVAPTFGSDMPDFDFDWQGLQSFDNDREDEETEQLPVKKRRSTRNSSKSVHYADATDDDEDEDKETPASTSRKHRPPPISTSRKSSTSSQISELNSADFQLFANNGDSVASRTRSKSVSASEDEGLLPTGKSSPSSLFDESEGENIVVATPKSAKAKACPSKTTSLALPPHPTTRSQSRGSGRRRS